ncbi:MAG: alpha/beta hydrolase [Pseudomonadota bacterium]|nr:alpha/beta hydrolase [Pseudomonadota bacterium]
MSALVLNEVDVAGPLEIDRFPQPDRSGSVLSISKNGFHRIAYVEWGDPNSDRVALCVHGLSRQGRDFDLLAAHLARRGWRVICPDLVGRGQSDWLRDPEEYNLPQYAVDMTVLIARLGVTKVSWIGTSLGGLIGMVVAGQADTPVSRLVVNDIGPFLSWQALHRLASSVRNSPTTFANFPAAVDFYRHSLAPFGNLADDEWDHLARYNVAVLADGTCRKYADPEITAAFKPGWYFNLSLWSTWDSIPCPVFALRGAESDLLSPSIANEMSRRGPHAEVVDIPDCGHAPALMAADQIALITEWLE